MKIIKSKFLRIAIIVIFFAASFIIWKEKSEAPVLRENNLPAGEENYSAEKIDSVVISQEERSNNSEKKEEITKIPDKFFIKVPFTTQAPFKIWDEYHEEACEEASLLMVKYFNDNKKLNPEIAEKEIQAMIKFQLKKYGDYRDSNAEELVRLAKDFYGMENLSVVHDFSKEDLKKWLTKGKPIIVPAAGRLLHNPNFTYPGPLYHNLVLTGYAGEEIITNDPGTRKGENYRYNIKVLYEAIHDFPGKKEEINKGRKAMIVLD